ncbi:MAG TPA: membrane protein insertase YidC, partial [Bacillota bacterium]|nr:membrane protein insertase YidC [Bacillota bacterium]
FPFMLNQSKQTHVGQEKMKELKPEMDEIQKKYKGKTSTSDQMEMQKELSALYQKHDYHPFKMVAGCLPMIIQMPFLIGFYYAIRRTPEIANQSFLWFNLGELDVLLIGIAVFTYFIQSRVSLIGLKGKQRKQASLIGLVSPIMIGIISFTMPAALPLYWAVGGMFMIVQTFIIKKFITR